MVKVKLLENLIQYNDVTSKKNAGKGHWVMGIFKIKSCFTKLILEVESW